MLLRNSGGPRSSSTCSLFLGPCLTVPQALLPSSCFRPTQRPRRAPAGWSAGPTRGARSRQCRRSRTCPASRPDTTPRRSSRAEAGGRKLLDFCLGTLETAESPSLLAYSRPALGDGQRTDISYEVRLFLS